MRRWDVTWAMSTRCDQSDDIDITHRAWSGVLDSRKKAGDNFNSRAIVDACKPFEWKDKFPPVAESSPELAAKTLEKWKHLLD
jgi:4-hydroxy-3-polyprenylbenzoate decarboxylase